MAYELIKDYVYPLGATYSGEAALSSFYFSTVAGIAAMPIAESMIDEFESQLLAQSLVPLRLKVWCDTSPILETDFYVEMSCTPTEHSPLAAWVIPLLYEIIPWVVAAVIAFLVYLSIREIKEILYSPAGPAVASAFKWLAIGLATFAGGLLVREVVKAIPKKEKA